MVSARCTGEVQHRMKIYHYFTLPLPPSEELTSGQGETLGGALSCVHVHIPWETHVLVLPFGTGGALGRVSLSSFI